MSALPVIAHAGAGRQRRSADRGNTQARQTRAGTEAATAARTRTGTAQGQATAGQRSAEFVAGASAALITQAASNRCTHAKKNATQ